MAEAITRGTTRDMTGHWHRDGSRVNVTGATMRFTAKTDDRIATVPLVTKTSLPSGGITFTNAVQGEYEIAFGAGDFNGVERDRTLPCSLRLEEADGTVSVTEIALDVRVAP